MKKIKELIPILEWLPNYNSSRLKGDFIAGITVSIILIPQGIAYALIAGLPPIYGLYCALVPQLVYAIFGSSRQVAIGPVAMDSLIVATGVSTLALAGSDSYIAIAILLALMVGSIQFLLGVFRLGFIVNFLSKPVISGFTSAVALTIGINQFRNLFGVDFISGSTTLYLTPTGKYSFQGEYNGKNFNFNVSTDFNNLASMRTSTLAENPDIKDIIYEQGITKDGNKMIKINLNFSASSCPF